MLYDLNWLQPGQPFPPVREKERIQRYLQNAMLFDGDHFDDPKYRTHDNTCAEGICAYMKCAERITQVIGNFDDVVSFPTLLNYQRLMSLKMADLVCGEYPTISGSTSAENAALFDVRDASDFDAKLYSTVIDVSRYGDAIWRMYKDYDDRNNFTCWDPAQWYPIVRQDGTNSIIMHCLCWRENRSLDPDKPDWYLVAQLHSCEADDIGHYEQREFKMNSSGTAILEELSSKVVPTGLDRCAVFHIKSFSTTNSVYGYDDYMQLDSILAEIMARIGQISGILDKHADPNITGPSSMLRINQKTGEYELCTGKFFATSVGENEPKYMTWDGQLEAAFRQLEFLVNQLYILSEMGAALLGGQDGASQAISGAAMRFKMVNPLAKARRIANSMTRPVRMLFSSLSVDAEVEDAGKTTFAGSQPVSENSNDTGNVGSGVSSEGSLANVGNEKVAEEPLKLPIPYKRISVFWSDGLPDDPRENIENCKLATGATKMMPLEKGIMEFFGRSNEEASQWIELISQETEANMLLQQGMDPNHSGPQDGTGVNSSKKGSETGLNNFSSNTNKKPEDKKK